MGPGGRDKGVYQLPERVRPWINILAIIEWMVYSGLPPSERVGAFKKAGFPVRTVTGASWWFDPITGNKI